ncbi:hypothetical protein AB0K60_26670 [Thermopolyspora sp. NPDC052614]|uniref:hypothetical protein n=1 Tax=Thermopolyspora sp. NPDC052614 TaxID=3155682 RepID=UPI003414BDE8
MAEGKRKGRRPRELFGRAIEKLDRSFWARDDDIAQRMNWQILRGRRGRRKYRDLRFDVLLIVRETRARKTATTFAPRHGHGLGPGGIGGLPSSGPFNLG